MMISANMMTFCVFQVSGYIPVLHVAIVQGIPRMHVNIYTNTQPRMIGRVKYVVSASKVTIVYRNTEMYTNLIVHLVVSCVQKCLKVSLMLKY